MNASEHGTSHCRRALELCRTQAHLAIHRVMAWTIHGQVQTAHLIRGRIHDHRHPASRSVAELPRKETIITSVSAIGVPRIQNGITSIAIRHHQFLDRLLCARGLKALPRIALNLIHTHRLRANVSGIPPAIPRCIPRARPVRLHPLIWLPDDRMGGKMGMKRLFMNASVTGVRDSRNGLILLFTSELHLQPPLGPILASSGHRTLSQP